MTASTINPVGPASAISRLSALAGDASSMQKRAAPVFSRPAADEGRMPSLRSLRVAEGGRPSNSEVRLALTGDLLRIVRDLRAGDLPKANAKLHEMKGTLPTDFLLENRLDPGMIAFMGKDMLLAPDAKTALGLVLKRLDNAGISRWHPQLRAREIQNKG